MIRDLNEAGHIESEADVLVIGGGTVGLVMASRLSKFGLNVVALESGGLKQEEEEHLLNEVVHVKEKYAGAAHGRFRCLGGTSTRWGGALIPFLRADLDGRGWPVSHSEILEYLPDVEKLFHLNSGSYEMPEDEYMFGYSLGENYVARLAKWPSFSNRNVANLMHSDLTNDNVELTVWYNATATQFKLADDMELREVFAQSTDGSSIRIKAKEVVFASGAIESTRLLLLLDQQNGKRLSHIISKLGHYFYDHLSVTVGTLTVHDRNRLNNIIGFRFEKNGVMRNIRFELSSNSSLRNDIPPSFVHVAFEELEAGGFEALRELFRCLQRRRLPSFSNLVSLLRALPWLLEVSWWRFVKKRLMFPKNAEFKVHVVIEQVPRFENKITLSNQRKDIFNQPLAEISWCIDEKDVAHLTKAADEFEKAWAKSELSSLATFVRRPSGSAEAELMKGGGIYHPGGSTKMAEDANHGVVDKDLKLFGVPNTSVIATSVLPTGGGANPTMMEMMLALRYVKKIATKFGKITQGGAGEI